MDRSSPKKERNRRELKGNQERDREVSNILGRREISTRRDHRGDNETGILSAQAKSGWLTRMGMDSSR